ncbi:C2H2 zinc finger protein [Musa troglodytarum]|uniref:C2H2 zinc finger protein n=1 Tax=Musa troglodytarum TaxID=320322 RepID=A0A9E7JKK4_9LILI|nr:C2H2 zinc finger protein [Musa troglodytarum]
MQDVQQVLPVVPGPRRAPHQPQEAQARPPADDGRGGEGPQDPRVLHMWVGVQLRAGPRRPHEAAQAAGRRGCPRSQEG